jgi:hypothetical protein
VLVVVVVGLVVLVVVVLPPPPLVVVAAVLGVALWAVELLLLEPQPAIAAAMAIAATAAPALILWSIISFPRLVWPDLRLCPGIRITRRVSSILPRKSALQAGTGPDPAPQRNLRPWIPWGSSTAAGRS